jgi:hypothetical protein
MHHTLAVSVVERERNLTGKVDRHIDRELPLSLKTIPKRFAADERHRVPQLASSFAGIVHRQDVRMLEPGSDLNLPLKARWTEGGGQLGVQDFQCNWTVVSQVMSQKYGGHTATSELALDAVAIREAALEPLG